MGPSQSFHQALPWEKEEGLLMATLLPELIGQHWHRRQSRIEAHRVLPVDNIVRLVLWRRWRIGGSVSAAKLDADYLE